MSNTEKPLNPTCKRRTFMGRLWLGLGIVALLQFVGGGLAFLISGSGRKKAAEPSFIKAGMIESFAKDSVTLIRRGELYLNHLEDGAFLALSRKCTHLGCAIAWDEKQKLFACPCHASLFDKEGRVLRAPAPRPLDLHPLKIADGEISVDIETIIKRRDFNPQQLTYVSKKG